MATAYTDQVQKVYIAYYGRAADPVGLAYWAAKVETDGLAGIMAAFGASAEATTLYGSLTSNTAKVNALYKQSFGRDADFAGLMYYAGQLTAGTMTAASIAQNIFDGASGGDATILANKLIVAKAYTAAIDTSAEVVAYSGTVAAASARTLLSTVDASTVTASFDVVSSIASVVTVSETTSSVTGNTVALTTGLDVVLGSSGDDTFSAIQSATATTETWDIADTITGGAGNDTLNLISEEGSAVNGATVTGVETVNYRAAVAGGNIDMVNLTGVTTLNLDRWTGASDVTNLNLATSVKITSAVGDMNSTVTYLAADVTGATDASTITLKGILDGVSLDFSGDVETMNLVTSAAAARFDKLVFDGQTTSLTIDADEAFRVDDTFTAAAVTSLVVTGDSAVRIIPTLADTVATIDASASTGSVNVLIGNVIATAKGGTGNDRFAFAAGELVATDTVTGGDGTDTLSIMDETLSTALFKEVNASTGIEILEMAATGATTDMSIAMSSLTSIDAVTFSGAAPVGTVGTASNTAAGAGTAAATITTNENDDAITITGDVTGGIGGATIGAGTGNGGAGGAAVTATNLVDGGSNSLSITLGGGVALIGGAGGALNNNALQDTTSGAGGAAISAATMETVNIVSSGKTANSLAGGVAGATPHATDIDGAAGSGIIVNTNGSINVTGTQNLDLGLLSGTNVSVDASTFTGKLTVVGEAGNNVLKGGTKVDTITGGDGQDIVTGGAGADIFIFHTDVDAELATGGATDANTITDYAADVLRLDDVSGNDVYSVAGVATLGAATTSVGINSVGLVSFHADDDTLAEKVTAIAADADIAANELAIFTHGADTYVYGSSHTGIAGDDYIIKLTGVTLTNVTEQNTSGDFIVA